MNLGISLSTIHKSKGGISGSFGASLLSLFNVSAGRRCSCWKKSAGWVFAEVYPQSFSSFKQNWGILCPGSQTAWMPLCASGGTGFDVACVWRWRGCYVTVGSGEEEGLIDKHVFLMQLSISLVGGDLKLRPNRVPAVCSCKLNSLSPHSSCHLS